MPAKSEKRDTIPWKIASVNIKELCAALCFGDSFFPTPHDEERALQVLDGKIFYEVRSFHEHLWGPHASMESEMTRLRMAQEDRCMNAAAAVVTISEAMRDALVRRGVDASKVSVVPNAIGEEFIDDPAGIPTKKTELNLDDGTVVGYISNFSAREGHDVLLKALALLRSEGLDVKGLLVGDGPTRPAMESLAGALGLADIVRFTGEVDHSSIKEYYRSIDVFVVPRKADYAADFVTPLKPFEAMALARPLIMSDRPVTQEIIGNEERGLFFETGDEAALAQKIKTVVHHPEHAAETAQQARAWVLANRTWRSNAESYRDLYADVLKACTNGPDV